MRLDFSSIHSPVSGVIRLVAAAKIGYGLLVAIQTALHRWESSLSVPLAHVLVYSAAGVWLGVGSRFDKRAGNFGMVCILTACSFAEALLNSAPDSMLSAGAKILLALEPASFLPFFLASFALEFPRASVPVLPYGLRAVVRLSWYLGVFLFVLNAAALIYVDSGLLKPFLEPDRSGQTLYWIIVLTALIPSAVISIWNLRHALPSERRRTRLFVTGLTVGLAPIVIEVVMQTLSPRFYAWVLEPANSRLTGAVIYPALLSIPLTTAYAVLVNRALDVRLIVRAVIEYAFARYSVMALSIVPSVLLALYVYRHRFDSVTTLMSGAGAVVLVTLTLLGVAAYRFRKTAFDFIDRRFFREQYDAHQILSRIVEKTGQATTSQALVTQVTQEIRNALHAQKVAFLLHTSEPTGFRCPSDSIVNLPGSSAVVHLSEGQRAGIAFDPDDPQSLFKRLPAEDRKWVMDTGCRMVTPVIQSDRTLLGLIVVSAKESGLPFSRSDQLLVADIAASAALSLENLYLRNSVNDLGTPHHAAAELAFCCVSCGAVQPDAGVCLRCKGKAKALNIPYVFGGKFRMDRRIGSGGMGVVYAATDLVLGRTVAVKTLPEVAPELALRLRREARAIASVTHRNLAVIFGAEAWRGTPLLVFEYLPGGTLAERLKRGPMDMQAVLRLGICLCDAIECIHSQGVLHRDIKPSNIGFDVNDEPKLMDFGLAKLLSEPLPETYVRSASADSTIETRPIWSGHSTRSAGYLVGTPPYLSPEALRGVDPNPRFDLWALSVTLYEAATRQNPFLRSSLEKTLGAIRAHSVGDIREFLPDSPAAVVSFFASVLAKDEARRPSTAQEMRRRIEAAVQGLAKRTE